MDLKEVKKMPKSPDSVQKVESEKKVSAEEKEGVGPYNYNVRKPTLS
ncbi:hypothetical protein [Alkalicoccus daliensis]|uniref:Uncharacterized protein n=1 Tax=Alkalicoccus daliensis TaxID=745820 RepID=A0A1H0B8D2_9BACI|nr:hypothetical protein [Alkalicoccus daliensis]SDN41914.1 hypothetical protein SAMN04488053_101794 [Alkalicoccus daliensis]